MEDVLKQLKELQQQCRHWQSAKEWEQLLEGGRRGTELEGGHPRWRNWIADALEGLGRFEEAEKERAAARALADERWQRQVEAELRGQHTVLGAGGYTSLKQED